VKGIVITMSRSQILEKFKSLIPYFLLATAIIAVYRISEQLGFIVVFFSWIMGVIAPFFYGFVLAYIINIPIQSVRKLLLKSKSKFVYKYQKPLSILAVFLSFIAIIALAFSFIIPAIVASIAFFIENIPAYWQTIAFLIEYFNELDLFDWYISPENILNLLGGALQDFSMEAIMQPFAAILGVGASIFTGFIAIISSIYILVEKDRFKLLLKKLLKIFAPAPVSVGITEIFSRLNKYFRLYIHTQTIDGIILGTTATLLLWALGSPYALVLGIMLGVVNYVPYFGSIFGTFAAVIVVFLTQGVTMGFIAAASLIVIQQIDANIIQPRLMGDSFALSPLLIIISITIGGAIAGVFGMLIAIPIVAVLKDIFDTIVAYSESKRQRTEDRG